MIFPAQVDRNLQRSLSLKDSYWCSEKSFDVPVRFVRRKHIVPNIPSDPSTCPRIKVVLVGDGAVGKSTFIARNLTGEFECKYVPTMGVDVRILKTHTNYGRTDFECWDTAGRNEFGR